jgi:hypothetical protein
MTGAAASPQLAGTARAGGKRSPLLVLKQQLALVNVVLEHDLQMMQQQQQLRYSLWVLAGRSRRTALPQQRATPAHHDHDGGIYQ